IGNLGDMTFRAVEELKAAQLIACEDTRVTRVLLDRYGIAAKTMAYHEHNAAEMRPKLLARLREGAVVALVTDAGTPCISDPGYKLVRDVVAAGIPVTSLPGPCAAITALTLAGLPTDRFFFQGFLPPKQAARIKILQELQRIPATLVFYESPSRLEASLADMRSVLGNREASVARELTKKFEEIRRDTLSSLCAHYEAQGAPKGEIVIAVAPPAESGAVAEAEVEALLRARIGALSVKEAVAEVASTTGMPRAQVYALALKIKDGL
ncbi:MAG: 16S rRNA (cytidine(1402)-2'-O)-methyltransferase, partial [Alphaproteobacteria bacterium]|nr:16S rRNA (cytidine(1402)-2'-O)-methyltransferase [Alphaproteobacteria bacterium]